MRARVLLVAAVVALGAVGFRVGNLLVPGALAHSDPCHTQHTCPSDHHTYVWTDTTTGLQWDCAEPGAPEYDPSRDTTTIVYGGLTYYCRAASAGSTTSTTTTTTTTTITTTTSTSATTQSTSVVQTTSTSVTATATTPGPGLPSVIVPDPGITPGALGANWSRTYCREIRLGDEGVCEFKMRWRVLRSHVAQITSIEEQVDEDGDRSYHMRLRDGTKLWTYGLTDFEDFLTRIERMSPTTQIKWHRSWRQRRQEKKRRAGEQCERVGGADE
jgi:hypothetical protein